MANHSSDLEPLLAAWGVDYDPTKVIGDLDLGLEVRTSMQGPPMRHIGDPGFAPATTWTARTSTPPSLETINVATAGFSRPAPAPPPVRAAAHELDQRGAHSRVAFQRARPIRRAARRLQADRHALRARGAHHGPVSSAFPHGAPPGAKPAAGPPVAHLAKSRAGEHRHRRRYRHADGFHVGADARDPRPANRAGVRQQRRLRRQYRSTTWPAAAPSSASAAAQPSRGRSSGSKRSSARPTTGCAARCSSCSRSCSKPRPS